jgi:DDE superfamily endonuclease
MGDRKSVPWQVNTGRIPCLSLTPRPFPCPRNNATTCSAWPTPPPHPRPSPAAPASSCVPPTTTGPPTCKSPVSSAATTTPSVAGAAASPHTASAACSTVPAPAVRRSFPPEQRLHVLALATREDPASVGCPAGSWSLDELARTILLEAHQQDLLRAQLAAAATAGAPPLPAAGGWPMSRSTIARILTAADLKPHKSAYWLNSHDPDFDAKARDICRLYLDASALWQVGELVLSSDEKTGILIRRRKHPSKPIQPGLPRRREHEYVRLGSTHLTATLCVPSGQVAYDLTDSHNGNDFAAHLGHAVHEMPKAERYHWVVDNNRTHSTPAVCARVAELSGLASPEGLKTGQDRRRWLSDPEHRHVFHFTPVHGSWLNQVELFFSVLSRKLLKRDDFASKEAFEERVREWLAYYNREWAHPYRWTYAGTPLVRDTPFARTRKQQRRGRAFFGSRPKWYDRLLYPPRPYHKAAPA